MTSETITIPVTPVQVACARIVANDRTRGHDHCRKDHESLGDAGNRDADLRGSIAEVVVYQALESDGLSPEGYVLVADYAPVGADFSLGKTSYNIKAVGRKGFLSINERQRTDPKHAADYVLPVSLGPKNIIQIHAPVSADEVATWPLREGHSPYRSIAKAQLKPLVSLSDLPGATPDTSNTT